MSKFTVLKSFSNNTNFLSIVKIFITKKKLFWIFQNNYNNKNST